MFSGSIPALITPFANGAVDEKSFQAFCEWQIAEGSSGLVPCGTTGESPTLSHDEHKRVVELCVEATNGRVPVIAGAGSNNTAEAIDLSQHAEKAGADAVLIVMPYYNKPTQAGMYAHFKAINDTYGHDVGDQALMQIGDLLRNTIRDIDISARYGGEEFIILLPEMTCKRANIAAERLRKEVEEMPIQIGGLLVHLTISIGVDSRVERVLSPKLSIS